MTPDNPVVTRYLRNLDAGLSGLNETDRAEAVRDIEHHITDALAAGEPLDRVLTALGSSESLARAYSLELLLKKPAAFTVRHNRTLRLIGLVLVGGLPTLIAGILGLVGVILSATGVILFFAARAALSDTLPAFLTMDADPHLVMIVGPMLSVVGLLALGGLWLYFHLATKVAMRVLPPKTVTRT
ncbi:MAG: hypothetical protein ABI672_15640 [Vicinamibacteria bacterium]